MIISGERDGLGLKGQEYVLRTVFMYQYFGLVQFRDWRKRQ